MVDDYRDAAVGTMTRNGAGKLWISSVTLHPEVRFGGERLPGADELAQLHHRAHDECFIANSVKTEVRCEPQYGAPS